MYLHSVDESLRLCQLLALPCLYTAVIPPFDGWACSAWTRGKGCRPRRRQPEGAFVPYLESTYITCITSAGKTGRVHCGPPSPARAAEWDAVTRQRIEPQVSVARDLFLHAILVHYQRQLQNPGCSPTLSCSTLSCSFSRSAVTE